MIVLANDNNEEIKIEKMIRHVMKITLLVKQDIARQFIHKQSYDLLIIKYNILIKLKMCMEYLCFHRFATYINIDAIDITIMYNKMIYNKWDVVIVVGASIDIRVGLIP